MQNIKRILQIIAPALLLISTLETSAAQDTPTTDWNNSSSLGDWFVDTNWTSGVPNSTTDARIRDSGFVLISAPSASAHDLYVGLTINGLQGDGTLQVSQAGSATPGSLTVNNLYVGTQDPNTATFTKSTGTLVIEKGATVVSSNTDLLIGSGYQSTGTVTVQDPNSALTGGYAMVGNGPNCVGTFNVQNGAHANCKFVAIGSNDVLTPMNGESPPNGSMTVTGAGSQLVSDDFEIGSGATGTLVVSSGGTIVNPSSNTGSSGATIAAYAGGANSAVTVTDSGSSWSTTGTIDVGGFDREGGQTSSNGGVGILRIQSGGLVQCSRLNAFANCEVTIDNGSSLTAGLRLSGGTGVMATGATPGDITIGRNSAGRMEVHGGGTAWSDRGFLGLNSGTDGSALVTDVGSKWSNSSLYVGLSGDGTLDVTNGGVVTSGADSFIGLTANTAGNATVSGAGSSWSVTGNLYIGGSTSGAGGSGVLHLDNGGTVTAKSATVYSTGGLAIGPKPVLKAPLNIQGGFMQFVLASNTIFPNNFTLGTGGLIVYTSGHPSTLSGSITGSGGLAKQGGGGLGLGTLTLTGASTYTGPTTVSTGKLVVNGSIKSAVTVNSGATLGGSGKVGSVTVKQGGKVAPGNSPGQLTIEGDYTQESGAVLEMEIGGASPGTGGYDQLVVSGASSLNGTLNLSLVNGYRPAVGDKFAIITSGSETGTFSTINSSGFTVSSKASGGGIQLTVMSVQPGIPVISSPTSASGTQGHPFSYQISATDSPTSYGASGLPAGLSVNTTTGLISGTPTVVGASSISISAKNSAGTGSATLTLTISAPPAPVVTTSAATNVGSTSATLHATVNPNGSTTSFQFTSSFRSFPVQDAGGGTASVPFTMNVTGLMPKTQYHFSATATSQGGTNDGAEQTFTTLAGPTPTPSPTPTPPSQLLNLSTRKQVGAGDNVLIGGFIIAGTDAKKVIVRGLGPSLSNFGVTGVLADPTLELHKGSTTVAANDNWKTKPDGSSQQAAIEATGIPPTNNLESAIVATLAAKPLANGGAGYTAILAGNGGGTGIGVLEIYDLAQAANSKLANISTRGFVGTGNDVLIGGFIPGPAGHSSIKVLVRALGPSLASAGVADPLLDPVVELHDGNGAVLRTNDNWKIDDQTGQSQQAEITATGAPPTDNRESALVATLPPSNSGYTAIVRGAKSTTGVAVVEVYDLQ
jgi:T5SS/PEP-CTERM-associated repeat protein/autotransporter-associated beta strand protein